MSDDRLAERMARMEVAVNGINDSMGEIKDAVKVISSALTDIVRLDQKHTETSNGLGRAFDALGKLESRVSGIEQALPILKLTSRWVISGTVAVVGMVGASLIYLVLL